MATSLAEKETGDKQAEKENLASENRAFGKARAKKVEIENISAQSLIELRKEYAKKSFAFMSRYTVLAAMVLIASGLGILDINVTPLAAFISTIPASMVLFGWVLKGLFDAK